MSSPGVDRWATEALYTARPQGFDATFVLFYETVFNDPGILEAFCYTDRMSYRAGEEVCFHLSTTAKKIVLRIHRDGIQPRQVYLAELASCASFALPPNFYEIGCQWPVAHRWRIPKDAQPGFYIVTLRVEGPQRVVREHEHGFVIRPDSADHGSRILLVLSNCTWTAYNDWGGANHYQARFKPDGLWFAPRLSYRRPWARGLIWVPRGAPRKTGPSTPVGGIPRYPPVEFAYTRGFSKFYASAGWATFERPFVLWAEATQMPIDIAAQSDLQEDPELLNGYRCIVFVGHDEYWTWEMRDAVDRYVTSGGNVARFAGNFGWQIRIEDEGSTQVCYKERAWERDPVAQSGTSNRTTSYWEDKRIDRPGARTFGLNASAGIYAGVGNMVTRGSKGFTIYRPDHWSLAGTELGFGDVLGASAHIFGYEVDGVDYTTVDGLPVPTFRDGAPESLRIIGMGLASNRETEFGHKGELSYYGDQTGLVVEARSGSKDPVTRESASRGAGMMVEFSRGQGHVFHAGSSEWVAGLEAAEPLTMRVTENVLRRYSGEHAAE